MATISEAFHWLEELTYNWEWFDNPIRHREIIHELGILNSGEDNKANNYFEEIIEHANELVAACQHLRTIIAEEEMNASNEKNHI